MPDRLVDLELDLAGVDHERRDLAGAVLRRQELNGFGRGSLDLLDQPEPLDVLPPAAEMWPRNEFGNDRRWSSPSAVAVASMPAPDWTVVWSIAVPSLVARTVRRRNRSMPPSANASAPTASAGSPP